MSPVRQTAIKVGDRLAVGGGSPFVLIAGPCVIESEAHTRDLAGRLVEITRRAGVPFVFVPWPGWDMHGSGSSPR